MAKSSLPRLTEKQIRDLATSQSFDRGDRYYRQGAIFNAIRQDRTLRASCQGSSLYQVQATLDNQGLDTYQCSCPYDWGGLCKHAVALLLTYVRRPEAFRVIPPMAELLAKYSPAELIELIETMIQQYPDLLDLIELAIPQSTDQPLDFSTYRYKVKSALKQDEVFDILKGLKRIENAAQKLQKLNDWLNAGSLYQILLQELIAAYDGQLQGLDYDGDVACLAMDAIAGMVSSLKSLPQLEVNMRRQWLNTLLEAELKDYDLGGMDFGAGAVEALFDFATPAEWKDLEARILAQIEQREGWEKEQLVNLLKKYYQKSGQLNKSSQIVYELGTPQQRAFLLIQEGCPEAAIAIAKQHFDHLPGLVIQFADALVEANYSDLALQLMTEYIKTESYSGYQRWLAKFYRTHGNPEIALELEYQEFIKAPSFPTYLDLRSLAQSVGAWETLQPQVLDQLVQKQKDEILIDIAIEEQDGDRALQLLNQVKPGIRISRLESVAKAIEQSQPKAAIALYMELVEAAIARKNRSAYQIAAKYLHRIKTIQSAKDWLPLMQQLRKTYQRLSALQDELDQAGL